MTAADWFNDYPSGSGFFPDLFYGPNLASSEPGAVSDISLLGASSEQLRGWGYTVRTVPSVDARIQRCVVLSGRAQETCWANLDHFLMEVVVPWVPIFFQTAIRFTSSRVASYSFDQSVGYPALDQMALTPAAIAGP